MEEILDDLSKAAWNFITLILSIFLFFYLKHSANSFVSHYGSDVKIRNLIIHGYLNDTMKILGLMALTIILFGITIFIAFKLASITSLIQIIVSIIFIIWTLSISALPFIGTLLLTIVVGFAIVFLINNTD